MAGYLETYGAGEERREKIIKRTLLIVLVVLAAGGALYFFLRNYREVKQAEHFLELLRQHDYKAAYRMWGCEQPGDPECHNYPLDVFMQDWGPNGRYGDIANAEIKKVRGCSTGVIITVGFGGDEEELLWVERKDRALGFAPWPVCNPRLPSPASR